VEKRGMKGQTVICSWGSLLSLELVEMINGWICIFLCPNSDQEAMDFKNTMYLHFCFISNSRHCTLYCYICIYYVIM